jgi:hypothetical protein
MAFPINENNDSNSKNLFSTYTSRVQWIHDSCDMVFKDPRFRDVASGTKKPHSNSLIIGIDVSASTRNSDQIYRNEDRGDRGYSNVEDEAKREQKLIPLKPEGFKKGPYASETGTDPVIAAELKCVLWYLIDYSKKYDVVGLEVTIVTFSSTSKLIGNSKITSGKSFVQMLKSISRAIFYDFELTDMLPLISYIFGPYISEQEGNIHVLIASDGMPNDINGVTSFLKSLPESITSRTSMAVIGAGSVRVEIPSFRGCGFTSKRDYTTNGVDFNSVLLETDKSLLPSIQSPTSLSGMVEELFLDSESEDKSKISPSSDVITRSNNLSRDEMSRHFSYSSCNIEFLLDIITSTSIGVYIPAYGYYVESLKTIGVYFDMLDESTNNRDIIYSYKSKLDVGLVDVPRKVNLMLNSGDVRVIAFIGGTVNKWYIYTREWQAAVKHSSGQILSKSEVYEVTGGVTSMDFNTAYNTKGMSELLAGGEKFYYMVDDKNRHMVRRVVKM